MPNTVIAAQLTLDSSQASTSVATFRTQLRNAQQDLEVVQAQFGTTSAEALAAAKGVATLRDTIAQAKQVSDLFNPAAKFEALTKAVQVGAGGITALTGAMALFGDQSEDVQKTLVKVQGALALSQGLSTLGELGRSFALLKVAAEDAFNAIKVGIGETGIGLLVIALGTIVAYWDDIKVAIGGATSEQIKNLDEATKILAIEQQKLDIINSQESVYKQQGLSQQQILDIQNKQLATSITAAQKALDAQKQITDQATSAATGIAATSLRLGNFGFLANMIFGKPEDVITAGEKSINAAQIELDKLKNQLAANQLDITKETADFNQKILSLQQAAAAAGITDSYAAAQVKLKNDNEAQIEQITQEYTNLTQRNALISATEQKYEADSAALRKAHLKQLHDDLRKINQDAYTANIQDQVVLQALQLKYQLDSDIEQTNTEIANLTDRHAKIIALTSEYDAKLSALRNADLLAFETKWNAAVGKQAQAEEDQFEKDVETFTNSQQGAITKSKEYLLAETADINVEIATANLDAAGQQAAASLKTLQDAYDKEYAAAKGNAASQLALTKQFEKAKTDITQTENLARLQIISGVLNQAAGLFAKQTVAYKVLAIAQATIDTYTSAVSAYKSLVGIPVVGPVLAAVGAGVAIAAGLENIAKIAAVQVPGADDSTSSVSISSSVSPAAPLTPQVATTSLPQQQINQIGNSADPVRAFVVESDISSNQERITRLNRQARLGGK